MNNAQWKYFIYAQDSMYTIMKYYNFLYVESCNYNKTYCLILVNIIYYTIDTNINCKVNKDIIQHILIILLLYLYYNKDIAIYIYIYIYIYIFCETNNFQCKHDERSRVQVFNYNNCWL